MFKGEDMVGWIEGKKGEIEREKEREREREREMRSQEINIRNLKCDF